MSTHKLPKPNVRYQRLSESAHNPDEIDDDTVRGMICNPIFAGLPHIPGMVDDDAWVEAAADLIREEGAEQFLVNMLHMLRASLADDQAPRNTSSTRTRDQGDLSETLLKRLASVEGEVYCSHDDFPMILVDDDFVCLAEYTFSHLEHSSVVDIISQPVLTLIFQNGHTMPLFDARTGKPLAVPDEDLFLNTLNGLSITDLGWDDDEKIVILEFGKPFMSLDDELDDQDPLEALEVHLDSIRNITCPAHEQMLGDMSGGD